MKKAVVSLAAVLMVLASFATPSFAAGNSTTYNGTRFSFSVNAPETVRAGSTLNVGGSIVLNDDGSNAKQRMLAYNMSAGIGLSKSGFHNFPVGRPKTIAKSFSVPSRLEPGDYTIRFQVLEGGENGIVTLNFRVVKP